MRQQAPIPTTASRLLRRSIAAGVVAACLGLAANAAAQSDANLVDVYEQAKESDPVLRQAEARYQAAQEALPQARAGLLPQLSGSAGYTWTSEETEYQRNAPDSDQDYTTLQYGLELRQPLFRWSTYKRLDQADASVAQAAANFAAAEQDLMIRVSERYFGVLSAEYQLRVARSRETAIERQLEQARQRFEVGLIARTSVEEAKARYDLARADVIAAENQVASSRQALRELTGMPMGELANIVDNVPLDRPEPNSAEAWSETAQEQNWQLTAARRAAEAAMANIGVQRGGHYPTLDLVGSYGVNERSDGQFSTGTGTVETGTVDTTQAQVGVQLNVPIFSGGATSSQVRQAQYEYTGSREQLEEVNRSVQRRTADAFRGVESSILRAEALEQALVSTRAALEAVEAGYEVGTRTIVDVLDAQNARFQAERDYQQALYDYLLNTLRLKLAAGTLSPEDLRAVSQKLSQ
ncbi:TolC family outer membrane protein [Ectothiorhodospiraceae bacterium WFHF3C12]|nr:TolC family outer membrane protein [Ectothiorhodospiraceae bacterium WFHF3C12]